MESIVVFGAGGHAAVVVSVLQACGYSEITVCDDDPTLVGTNILGAPVIGPIKAIPAGFDGCAIIAIGRNGVRAELDKHFRNCRWVTAVHPQAYVHESVVMHAGTVVFAGAVVQPSAVIGRHVIINTSVSIDHDCKVADFAHLAPGVHLAGNVSIGEGGFLGIGSVIIPGKSVGAWSVVGAGGVVIRDVSARTTVIGVPARPRSSNRSHKSWSEYRIEVRGPPTTAHRPLSSVPSFVPTHS